MQGKISSCLRIRLHATISSKRDVLKKMEPNFSQGIGIVSFILLNAIQYVLNHTIFYGIADFLT